MTDSFESQFHLTKADYENTVNFVNWIRYFYIFKEVINSDDAAVMEVGSGNGIVKNLIFDRVKSYKCMDINESLSPDYLMDVCIHNPKLSKKFDIIIASEVLEHIKFELVPTALKNLKSYLKPKGKIIITVPNRRTYFLFMGPSYKPIFLSVLNGALSIKAFIRRFILKNVWIDPHHAWEISDGKVSFKSFEEILKNKFIIREHKRLVYVDFFVLH